MKNTYHWFKGGREYKISKDEAGKIPITITHPNGRSVSFKYDEEGDLREEIHEQNGTKVFAMRYDDDKPYMSVEYKDGKKSLEIDYEEGEIHIKNFYDQNENIRRRESYNLWGSDKGELETIEILNDKKQLHSENGKPARIYYEDGENTVTIGWYKDGQLHREDGPAEIYTDPFEEYRDYYINGELKKEEVIDVRDNPNARTPVPKI